MSHILGTGGGQALLDPDDTLLLLLDHQSGLFETVKDIEVTQLRANTTALAKLATVLKLPIITTASVPDGPNGPVMPEIAEAAPHANYVPRKGEVNAWDNEAFVEAVRETGRKTLIMAGVWTSVCVMFPALDATAAGFKVYAVIDASGDPSELASRTTLARFAQAGIIPTSTNAVICELHRTGCAELPCGHGEFPASTRSAQQGMRQGRVKPEPLSCRSETSVASVNFVSLHRA